MQIIGYKNLRIVSVERDKDAVIDIIGDLYTCKKVTYDSRTNAWEVEEGRKIMDAKTY